jgi:hypothetical protein
MKKLIEEGLEEDAVIEGMRDERLGDIVDEIERTIPKTEAEIAEEEVPQAETDVEARVMPDGRLYLYGSTDVSGRGDYCGHLHYCFSTDDMENWVEHGIIFRNDKTFQGIPWSPETPLYAPDAIEKNGKYYLYVCGSRNEEGVAVGESPLGPFSQAKRIEIADGDGIDPAEVRDAYHDPHEYESSYHHGPYPRLI